MKAAMWIVGLSLLLNVVWRNLPKPMAQASTSYQQELQAAQLPIHPENSSGVIYNVIVVGSERGMSILDASGGTYYTTSYLAIGSEWDFLALKEGEVVGRSLSKAATCTSGAISADALASGVAELC
jgi:hypothetical protein